MVIVDGKMGEIGKMVLFWSISQVGDRRLLREGERIFWEEVMLFFRFFLGGMGGGDEMKCFDFFGGGGMKYP